MKLLLILLFLSIYSKLKPILLPRPNGGFHNFSFNIYGAPSDLPSFINITIAMKNFKVGSGFDPIPFNKDIIHYVSPNGWPLLHYPPNNYSCFQVPDCPNHITKTQLELFNYATKHNIFQSIQFGEWGNFWGNLRPRVKNTKQWWHNTFPNKEIFLKFWNNPHDASTPHLCGYNKYPDSHKEAYNIMKNYVVNRIKKIGNKMINVHSITCLSHYEAYAGLWNASIIGLELQCNRAQTAIAMARGASRRTGKPWGVQPSGWLLNGVTGCGSIIYNNATHSCSGTNAGRSYSYFWRTWLHSWFAGSAYITAENSAIQFFKCYSNGTTYTNYSSLTKHGKNAQIIQRLFRNHKRGTTITPLGVIIDKYIGYGAPCSSKPKNYTNHAEWGILNPNKHSYQLTYLLDKMLWPFINTTKNGTGEWNELRSTPYGEIADIILSDTTNFNDYSVLLLVGDIDFNDNIIDRLVVALYDKVDKLIIQYYHIYQLGSKNLERLLFTNKLDINIEEYPISKSMLTDIINKYLPVKVIKTTKGGILWQVNNIDNHKFAIELSNYNGIYKEPCSAMVVDKKRFVNVTLLTKQKTTAINWITNEIIGKNKTEFNITITPGNATIIGFTI